MAIWKKLLVHWLAKLKYTWYTSWTKKNEKDWHHLLKESCITFRMTWLPCTRTDAIAFNLLIISKKFIYLPKLTAYYVTSVRAVHWFFLKFSVRELKVNNFNHTWLFGHNWELFIYFLDYRAVHWMALPPHNLKSYNYLH